MPIYQVIFARTARQELEELPRRAAERILAKITTLADNPRPRGCRKLQGSSQLWRIRVGEYRVIYAIEMSGEAALHELFAAYADHEQADAV
jgi:mRNA interferase RelE/StbE